MRSRSHPDRPPASVLLVEDEADVRLVLSTLLTRSGRFEVVAEAVDAAEGIRLAAELRPEIVLLDLRLPDRHGLRIIPSILARSPASMLVALSGLEASSMAPIAMDAGAFAFVEKTHIGRDLVPQLESLLSQFRRVLDGEDMIAPAMLQLR